VDWFNPCEQPLRLWAVTQILIQLSLALVQFAMMWKSPNPDALEDNQARRSRSFSTCRMLSRSLNMMWFIWFLVGTVWAFQALQEDQCSSSAPFLFRICFSITIIQIILLSIIVLLCCCACVVLVLRLAINPAELRPSTSRGATDETIRNLFVKRYRDGLVPKEDANCAICLSAYEDREPLRFLPCHHHYHKDCIDKWLVTNKACPFCKRNVDEPPPTITPHTSITARNPSPTDTPELPPDESIRINISDGNENEDEGDRESGELPRLDFNEELEDEIPLDLRRGRITGVP